MKIDDDLTYRIIGCAMAQAKNYLVAYNYDVGLLLNFGSASLEYKRIYKSIKGPGAIPLIAEIP